MVSCLGSLGESCCWEGGALQTNVTGVCGEHSQCSGHTGFAPGCSVCFPRPHCSGYMLLYRERALSCRQLQFSGTPQKHRLGWACVCAFPARAAQAARSLTSALSPDVVHLIPSAVPASDSAGRSREPSVCSGELVSSRDPPSGCQPSRISGGLWLETGSLFAVW